MRKYNRYTLLTEHEKLFGTIQSIPSGIVRIRTTLSLSIVSLLSSVACAADDTVLAKCVREAGRTQEINISSGVYTEKAVVSAPLHIEIPAAIDSKVFEECLVREGFDAPGATQAYFDRLHECQGANLKSVANAADGGVVRLGKAGDAAAVESCLNSDIEVDVELGD